MTTMSGESSHRMSHFIMLSLLCNFFLFWNDWISQRWTVFQDHSICRYNVHSNGLMQYYYQCSLPNHSLWIIFFCMFAFSRGIIPPMLHSIKLCHEWLSHRSFRVAHPSTAKEETCLESSRIVNCLCCLLFSNRDNGEVSEQCCQHCIEGIRFWLCRTHTAVSWPFTVQRDHRSK